MTTDSAAYLTELHKLLSRHFNREEIHTLCFKLNIDYESVPGAEKPSMIRELLLALGRNGRLPEFITLVRQHRPNVHWPLMPDDFQLPVSLAAEEATIATSHYDIYGDMVQGDKVGGDKVIGDKHIHYHAHKSHSKPPLPPMMALAPPDDFVQRPQEFEQLINHLLTGNEQTVAITATIKGAGGFGKTTLAQAICHDKRIRQAFPDGILWTTIGDDGANVLLGLRKLYQALTGQEAQFADQHDATTQLGPLLAGHRYLIVVDDAWNAAHLQPFLQGGEQCARLVTTRLASVVPKSAEVVHVDAMQGSEAVALLGAGLDNTDGAVLANLAQRLGEWPLLLKLVNRRLYEDVVHYGISLTEAITSVMGEYDEFGLTSFDIDNPQERHQAVAATMGVGLKHLHTDALYGRQQVDEVSRFLELAIFPEDALIPLSTVAHLWQQTGNLSAGTTEKLCRRLADLSLVLRYDIQKQTILLHDVTRHYLLEQPAPDQIRGWQNALLGGYHAQCDGQWWQLADDGYIHQNLLWHMRQGGQQDQLEQLLFTYSWLDAKLQANDIISLIADFDLRRDKDRHSPAGLLKHALQMSVSVLAQDKDQLVSQLYGRLSRLGNGWQQLINACASQERVAWLQPKPARLTPPGGNLLYTLRGHTAGAAKLLLTPDGRLISSCDSSLSISRDATVKVWDIESGTLLYSLEGHSDGVAKLLLTPDGRLISSCGFSSDTTVKVWDIESGSLLHSLEGHSDGVAKLLLTPDGRLISSCGFSSDTTVKVWDIENGTLLHSLEGHTDGVSNLLLAPDGRLISSCSGSIDTTVKVWDIENGTLLYSLVGHRTGITKLLLTPDGRLISSCLSSSSLSKDTTVKVWDIESGSLLHSLEGHSDGVANLLLTPDGRLISSGSSDTTVKVWDIESGSLLHSLEGHRAGVDNLLLTPDGRLISSCRSYGRITDTTVKVWDIESGSLLHSLEGHSDGVANLLLTPDGRLISSCGFSRDTTVKVWDIESGSLLHSLEGRRAGVSNLLLTPDGRLISSCGSISNIIGDSDTTVKVWDIESGSLLHSLEGHRAGVDNLLLTPDGRLISSCRSGNIIGDSDTTVKVWDITTGTLLHSLEGHIVFISKMVLLPRLGCFLTAGGQQLNVWHIDRGEKIAQFTTDGEIHSCVVAPDGTIIVGDGLGRVHFLNLVEPN